MTIARQDFYIEYVITAGDASRVEFPFEFPVKSADDIRCFDVAAGGSSTQLPSSDFFVTPSAGGLMSGGSVALVAPVAVGHVFRIERRTPLTQLKVFRNQDRIPPEEVEDGLDRSVMALQEISTASIDARVDEIENEVNSLAGALNAEAGARIAEDQRLDAVKLEDAPEDGKQYGRKNGAWAEIEASGGGTGLPDGGAVGDMLENDAPGSAVWKSKAQIVDAMPKGTDTAYGVVKVDGTSIVSSGGVLTAIGGGGGGGTTDHRALTNRDAADQHPQSAIIDLVPNLAGKAATVHTHDMSQVNGLTVALDGKAAAIHTHNMAQVDGLTAALDGKASTQALVDGLAAKADAAATAAALNSKAPLASPALTGSPTVNGTPLGGMVFINDAPSDGKDYLRNNGAWNEASGGAGAGLEIVAYAHVSATGLLGRKTTNVISCTVSSAQYTVTLSGVNLTSGNYFLVCTPFPAGTQHVYSVYGPITSSTFLYRLINTAGNAGPEAWKFVIYRWPV